MKDEKDNQGISDTMKAIIEAFEIVQNDVQKTVQNNNQSDNNKIKNNNE